MVETLRDDDPLVVGINQHWNSIYKYDWDLIFKDDGHKRLVRFEEIEEQGQTRNQFRRLAYTTARRRGIPLAVRERDIGFIVWVYRKDESALGRPRRPY